jgi:hypothetical protein
MEDCTTLACVHQPIPNNTVARLLFLHQGNNLSSILIYYCCIGKRELLDIVSVLIITESLVSLVP